MTIVVGWVYDLVPIDEESAALMEGYSPAKDAGLPSSALPLARGKTQINPRVPPLLDASLPAYDRFITHGLCSCRLQREIAHMTGQDPNYLPFAWSLLIKFFTPTVVLGLMIYNIKQDAERSYGNYPRWTNNMFGWFCCLAVPVVMLVMSIVRPLAAAPSKEGPPAPVAAVSSNALSLVEA